MCCTPNKLFLGKKDLTAAYLTYSKIKTFFRCACLSTLDVLKFHESRQCCTTNSLTTFHNLLCFFPFCNSSHLQNCMQCSMCNTCTINIILSILAFVNKDFFCSCFHSICIYFFNSSVSQWIHFTPGFYNLDACADTKDKSHFSMLLTIQLEFQLWLR